MTEREQLVLSRSEAAVTSTLVGVGVAVPDYVKTTPARLTCYTGLIAAGVGYLVATREPDEEWEIPDNPEAPDVTEYGPVRTWLVLAFVVLALFLSVRMDMAVTSWLARKLKKWGVRRPYTAVGAAYAVLAFGAFEADRQLNGQR